MQEVDSGCGQGLRGRGPVPWLQDLVKEIALEKNSIPLFPHFKTIIPQKTESPKNPQRRIRCCGDPLKNTKNFEGGERSEVKGLKKSRGA